MSRTMVAKNGHLCVFSQIAVASLAAVTVAFPRGVNRVILSTDAIGPYPIQWRPDSTAPTAPTSGGAPAGFAEAGSGCRSIGLGQTVIEVEAASRQWSFRNLAGVAVNLIIEGHIVGGSH